MSCAGKKEEYRRERIGQVDKEKSGRKETKRRKRKNWEGAADLWAIVWQAKWALFHINF